MSESIQEFCKSAGVLAFSPMTVMDEEKVTVLLLLRLSGFPSVEIPNDEEACWFSLIDNPIKLAADEFAFTAERGPVTHSNAFMAASLFGLAATTSPHSSFADPRLFLLLCDLEWSRSSSLEERLRSGSLVSPFVAAVAGMCDKRAVAGRFLTLLDGWLLWLEDSVLFELFDAPGDEQDDAEDIDAVRCGRNILA